MRAFWLILFVVVGVGCGKPKSFVHQAPISSGERVRDVLQASEPMMPQILAIEDLVTKSSPGTIEQDKSLILTKIMDFKNDFQLSLIPAVHALSKEVTRIEGENKTLKTTITTLREEAKKSDPVRTWFGVVGWIASVAGLAGIITGIYGQSTIPFLGNLKTIGAAIMTFGLCLITIAYFMTQIRYTIITILAVGLGSLVVWVILNRKVIFDKFRYEQEVEIKVHEALMTPVPPGVKGTEP